ncbi:MAG TPA: hypothetical protein VIN08_22155 [Ohtaekwangia sp.]|uniref:hypothetical protein n=1 Tax=Ohtaekwangia sp. TaxID=2066019 RepID=UPI002F9409F4
MKQFNVLLLVLLPLLASAQIGGSDGLSNLESISSGSSMFRSFDNRFKGIEGYPTIFENYVPGKIILTRGKAVVHPLVNYDIYSNELLVKRNDQEVIVTRNMVKSFVLLQEADSLFFVKVRLPQGEVFCEELVAGKIKLYKFNVKTVRQASNTGAYSAGKTYSQFEEAVKYYWQAEGKDIAEIKNKKSLIGDLKTIYGIDPATFIKDNDINLKDAADVRKLFEYIDSKI